MEIVLTHETNRQICVNCNNLLSHTFDLGTLNFSKNDPLIPPEDPISYGKVLFQALFPTGTISRAALDKRPENIILITTSNELDAIPWEFIYGPDDFLVLTSQFVRGLPADQRITPPTLDVNLHIIAIPSNPLSNSLQLLNIEGEWLRLVEVIENVPFSCTVERTRPPTLERMRQLLANQRHRVMHFMGHGGQADDGVVLYFEKENGDIDIVTARQFGMRVRGTAFLITLNACVSASPGLSNFSNLALTLVRQKIPYVLGMRFSIHDEDARTFSRNFYSNLASGTSIEEALLQARLAIATSSRKWAIGTPVMYTSLVKPTSGFIANSGTPDIRDFKVKTDIHALPQTEGTFQGRIDELKLLGELLTGDDRARIITIHGGGGQGKTALARKAVERFAYAWPGGVWATSLENLPSKEIFIADLAHFLGVDSQNILNSEQLERLVQEQLAKRRVLIVLDNAETIFDAVNRNDENVFPLIQFIQHLPNSMVSLLITSRILLGWDEEQSCELGGLSPQEGALLFQQSAPQRVNDIEKALAKNLSNALDGHPLGLYLLGKAFNDTSISLHSFITTYEKQLVGAENKYVSEDHKHRRLYACIEMSIRYLDKDLSSLLSGLWVFHAPFLAETAVKIFDPKKNENNEDLSPVRDKLYTLWKHGLLTASNIVTSDGILLFYQLLPTTRSFIEHYMEQIYEKGTLLSRLGVAYSEIVKVIDSTLDHSPYSSVIAQVSRVDLQRGSENISGIDQGYYLMHWGWVLHRIGTPLLGLQMLEQALEIAQGKDQILEVSTLHNIGFLYQYLGRPQQALGFYETAILIRKKIGDRIGEAGDLNNLAGCYEMMGQLQKALGLYDQTLSIAREVNDRNNEAMTLNNLATIYLKLGNERDAIHFNQQALPIMKEVNNYAGEALSLTNLAGIYHSRGELNKALDLLQQALVLREKINDPSGIATVLNSTATIYSDMGKNQEALKILEQILDIQRDIHDQRGEAITLNNLAYIHTYLGNIQEAMNFYEQALPLLKSTGDQEVEFSALNNLSDAYSSLEQHEKALSILEHCLNTAKQQANEKNEILTLAHIAQIQYRMQQPQEALRTYKNVLPRIKALKNPSLELQILDRVASFYQGIGLLWDALELREKILPLCREIKNSEIEARTLNHQAMIHQSMGQFEKALKLFESALKLFEKENRRKEMADILNNIAMLYHDMKNSQEALNLLKQALLIRREVMDRNGEAITLNNIGRVYQDLMMLDEALEYFDQSLPLRKEVGDPKGAATTLGNIAAIYHIMGNSQEALEIFEDILPIKVLFEDRMGQASVLHNLAYLLWDVERYDEALERFKQAVKVAQNIPFYAGEAAGLVGLAILQYSELNHVQDAILSMNRAIATLEKASLDRDAVGNTIEKLHQLLRDMHTGNPLNRSNIEDNFNQEG